ncbi:MAG: hypothetical protein GTO12_13705 [Proteobacteria bacterium]|nr:hypothetical protein [Pseudomonadota bacterium]
MNRLFSVRSTGKERPVGVILSTFLVLICITIWAGKSALQASEDTGYTVEVSFPNDAQAQLAENVATSAALRDLGVVAAFEYAKKTGNSGDLANAEALLAEKVENLIQEIADMRRADMGWGEIAREFGVHPGVLGLGHSKKEARDGLQAHVKGHTENPGKKLGLGHDLGSDHSVGHGGGHGRGHGGGNGGGHGGKNK